MKKNEMLKKAIAVAAVTTMVITSAGMVFAASFTDIDGHWAKERIITWSEDGVVNGYPDESFRPNNSITRAEFMSLIDKAFELTEEAEIAYPDVDENAWYYDLVKRAQAQGYISGYDDGTMKPENPITRQEAAAIVTRIMELEKNAEKIVQFLDHEGFQDWGKGYIGAAAKARYMNGDDQGNFRALDNITRAEAVTVLDNIFYGENHDEEDEIVVEEAEYGFVVTGDSYTVGELTTPEDQDFEGKEAITIKLEEIVAGTAFEGKVRIAAVDVEGIQLWANDGNGNWYDINQVGWGPVEGFELDLTAETEVYVFVAESVTEDINVTFKLVDATDVDNVIAEGTKVLTVEEKEIVVEEAEYGFVVTGDSYTVGELTTPEDQDFEGKEAITIKLEEIVAGTAFEGKVRIAAVDVESIQLWANDGNGNWYDINQVGWGPVEGFEIDLETETEIYVFVAESVTEDINVTFKLVDATDVDNVIAEGTKVLTVEEKEIVVEEAEYGFVVTGDSYTVGELTTPEDQDFEGKEALTIKLEETVAGTAFEGKVRIAAVDVEGIQLWANDGNGNWYDINQVGWGPVEGFEIDLETETEIYVFVAESVTEDINVTFKLVDATDVDNVIAEGTKTLIIEE